MISFSGREAVKQRVSVALAKLRFSRASDWFVEAWMLWPAWLFDRRENMETLFFIESTAIDHT